MRNETNKANKADQPLKGTKAVSTTYPFEIIRYCRKHNIYTNIRVELPLMYKSDKGYIEIVSSSDDSILGVCKVYSTVWNDTYHTTLWTDRAKNDSLANKLLDSIYGRIDVETVFGRLENRINPRAIYEAKVAFANFDHPLGKMVLDPEQWLLELDYGEIIVWTTKRFEVRFIRLPQLIKAEIVLKNKGKHKTIKADYRKLLPLLAGDYKKIHRQLTAKSKELI